MGKLLVLAFAVLAIFLWGRLFLDMLEHPARAILVIVLPIVGIGALMVLAGRMITGKRLP
jgi:hypothetical protein